MMKRSTENSPSQEDEGVIEREAEAYNLKVEVVGCYCIHEDGNDDVYESLDKQTIAINGIVSCSQKYTLEEFERDFLDRGETIPVEIYHDDESEIQRKSLIRLADLRVVVSLYKCSKDITIYTSPDYTWNYNMSCSVVKGLPVFNHKGIIFRSFGFSTTKFPSRTYFTLVPILHQLFPGTKRSDVFDRRFRVSLVRGHNNSLIKTFENYVTYDV